MNLLLSLLLSFPPLSDAARIRQGVQEIAAPGVPGRPPLMPMAWPAVTVSPEATALAERWQ